MTASETSHHPASTNNSNTAPAPTEASLFGFQVTSIDPNALSDALEKAFDYRGDVTITRKSAPDQPITGYIFDRRKGPSLDASTIRLMTATSDDKVTITYSDIAAVHFSGKDAAHGKSFETWIKKYIEKKSKGEKASIESESL
jgi:hypothetical protein